MPGANRKLRQHDDHDHEHDQGQDRKQPPWRNGCGTGGRVRDERLMKVCLREQPWPSTRKRRRLSRGWRRGGGKDCWEWTESRAVKSRTGESRNLERCDIPSQRRLKDTAKSMQGQSIGVVKQGELRRARAWAWAWERARARAWACAWAEEVWATVLTRGIHHRTGSSTKSICHRLGVFSSWDGHAPSIHPRLPPLRTPSATSCRRRRRPLLRPPCGQGSFLCPSCQLGRGEWVGG